MTRTAFFVLFFALTSLCYAADSTGPGCSADAVSVLRDGWWQQADGLGVIYEITVTNSGLCPLSNVGLSLSLPDGGEIVSCSCPLTLPFHSICFASFDCSNLSTWNLEPTSLFYQIVNYPYFAPDTTATAGIIAYLNATTPSNMSVTVYGASCPSECLDALDDTPTPTPTPTTSPCIIEASLAKSSSWLQDDVVQALYVLTITNEGECPMTAYNVGFGYYPGDIVQSWNLEPALGGFQVTGYGNVLTPGSTYSGAGFIVSNATDDVQLQPYGSACRC